MYTGDDVLKDIYDYETRSFSLLFSTTLLDFTFIVQPIAFIDNIDRNSYQTSRNCYF